MAAALSISSSIPSLYDQLCALPEHVTGQIVNGQLYAHPRPATGHAIASSSLGEELGPPFKRGKGGPGGWIFLDEPELHFGANVLVPDIAGWRRERMPEVPLAPFLTLAPDWVCEVLSPSTASFDRKLKLPIYAREGVRHVWLVDPASKTLELLRLDGEGYRLVLAAGDDDQGRFEPFEAIVLELAILWAR